MAGSSKVQEQKGTSQPTRCFQTKNRLTHTRASTRDWKWRSGKVHDSNKRLSWRIGDVGKVKSVKGCSNDSQREVLT